MFQTTFGIKEICGTAIIRHQNNTKLGARGNSVLATLNGISTCIVGFGNNLRNAEAGACPGGGRRGRSPPPF